MAGIPPESSFHDEPLELCSETKEPHSIKIMGLEIHEHILIIVHKMVY